MATEEKCRQYHSENGKLLISSCPTPFWLPIYQKICQGLEYCDSVAQFLGHFSREICLLFEQFDLGVLTRAGMNGANVRERFLADGCCTFCLK